MPAPNTLPSLWDFALSFYAKPQVAETCVELQDTYGCNVCLLIGLGWLDERKEFLSATKLENLESHIQTWTLHVIEPLRAVRRLLKQPLAAYVQDDAQAQVCTLVKQAELLAEKKLLVEIESWLLQLPDSIKTSSSSNVENYLQKLSAPTSTIEFIQKKFASI